MVPEAVDTEAPRRADAIRNRERLIAAAEEVFSERGLEAGIPEIAERAGVGKGTVYRNFESKEELIAAILILRLERMDADIVAALEQPDPGAAVREVLTTAASRSSRIGFPPSVFLPGQHAELDAVKKRLKSHMAELFRDAKESGELRSDATVDELFVLFGGICRVLAESGQKSPRVWRRHADLVVDAFRSRD